MNAIERIGNQIEEARKQGKEMKSIDGTSFYEGVVFGLKFALAALEKESSKN